MNQNQKRVNTEKIYDFEDRLVRFAGEVIFFSRKLSSDYELDYYRKQLIRSSGSSALNYGEAQGTVTERDFINKLSLVSKELKESKTSLKILKYINTEKDDKRDWLLEEAKELIAIASKMILNKRSKLKTHNEF